MITTGTLDRVYRTPEQATAEALAHAHRRFQIGCRVVHMGGQAGSLRDIVTDDGEVRLVIVTDDNRVVRDLAGYWSRSAL